MGNIWPDSVRIGMIEKSEIYKPDDKVYNYGYYDGYQKGREDMMRLILTCIGSNVKGDNKHKGLIGKLIKACKYGTIERTVLNFYSALKDEIKYL